MGAEIFYFTGTGNSLFLTKLIAEKLDAKITPIASLTPLKTITPDNDIIGIVFPVYYCDLPIIVSEFVKRLRDIENKYIFSVANYGGAASISFNHLGRLIQLQGGILHLKIGIHMPQNAFAKPWEKYENLYRRSIKMVDKLSKKVNKRAKGSLFSSRVIEYIFYPFYFLFKPLYKKDLMKKSHLTENHKLIDMIQNIDITFSATNECNGCETCVKICPVNNITLENNNPVWHHHCENCMACYHYCPKHAIQGEVVQPGFYYQHPDIKMKEIIGQKGNIRK